MIMRDRVILMKIMDYEPNADCVDDEGAGNIAWDVPANDLPGG